jgi:hypothetical protein
MIKRVTLYPITSIAEAFQDDPFDPSQLPAEIVPNITIEKVSPMFNERTFSLFRNMMGEHAMKDLDSIHYAIVHRFDAGVYAIDELGEQSVTLVNDIAACLRIIRPMREGAALVRGNLKDDGTIEIQSFDHPLSLLEVPPLQRTFGLRNKDIRALQTLASEFQRAMHSSFWKFRMAVAFHEDGHFSVRAWKSRFLLWCSAVEAIFTSQNPNHQGSRVAKARIKWFLGANTSIFAPGDIQSFLRQEQYSVGDILDDLYEVRNYVAHGEKIPDRFFDPSVTDYLGLNANECRLAVLHDGLSFVIRASLLRILRDNLLHHFADGTESDKYFGAAGLMKSSLRSKSQPLSP